MTSLPAGVAAGPGLERRLSELQDRTGCRIRQQHGQRIFGPPSGWSGPEPGKGTEVYCYRLPRDCYEDELVPIFSSVGEIYELRLMVEFSGNTRSYCYVRYTTVEAARQAIRKLNNHQVRPGHALAVTRSVDNRKLCLQLGWAGAPADWTAEVAEQELGAALTGVTRVRLLPASWCEVEFDTHRQAALARRQLVPGRLSLSRHTVTVRQVDWADPEPAEVEEEDIPAQPRVLALRNIPPHLHPGALRTLFNQLSGDAVENVVLGRRGPEPESRGLGLIVLTNHLAARRALVASRAGGVAGLVVDWWAGQQHQRRPLPSPVDQLLEHSLARGWGVPHYSQANVDEPGSGRKMYQCRVTVMGQVYCGSWFPDLQRAMFSAARTGVQHILVPPQPPLAAPALTHFLPTRPAPPPAAKFDFPPPTVALPPLPPQFQCLGVSSVTRPALESTTISLQGNKFSGMKIESEK